MLTRFIREGRDSKTFPTMILLETGQEIKLPDQDLVTFGRFCEQGSLSDVVLECFDAFQSKQISRCHFELRCYPKGISIRSVTSAPTSLNGHPISKGEEWPICAGDSVRVGNVLSMTFKAPQEQTVYDVDVPILSERVKCTVPGA